MRIAVVGTVVADTIELPDLTTFESLGGIAHTLAALARWAPGDCDIIPVCRVGADLWPRVESFLDELKVTTRDGLLKDAAANTRVHLSYASGDSSGERVERLSRLLAPLSPDEVAPAFAADVTLLNCITGHDVTAAALHALGRHCDRLYLDVHSLALGSRPDGTRYYRQRPDWDVWLRGADVVQCNRAEAASICGLDADTAAMRDVTRELGDQLSDLVLTATPAAAGRPSAVNVTLGAEGAVVFFRHSGGWSREHLAAPSVNVVDPTGAGDAFGAGYVVAWVAGASPVEAARTGVRAGSAACTRPGVPGQARPSGDGDGAEGE